MAQSRIQSAGRNAVRNFWFLTALFLFALTTTYVVWCRHEHQDAIAHAQSDLQEYLATSAHQAQQILLAAEVLGSAVDRWMAVLPRSDARAPHTLMDLLATFEHRTLSVVEMSVLDSCGTIATSRGEDETWSTALSLELMAHMISVPPGTRLAVPVQMKTEGETRFTLAVSSAQSRARMVTLLTAYNADQMLWPHGLRRHNPNVALSLWRLDGTRLSTESSIAGPDLRDPAHAALWRAAATDETGVMLSGADALGGGRYAVAFARLSDWPLVVVATVPLAPLLQAWWQQAILVLFLLVLVFVATLSYATLRVRALREFSSHAELMAEMAQTDQLTGVANRRHVWDAGNALVARTLDSGRSCALLMVDVDHFKRINDSFGHEIGDRTLRALAARLEQNARIGDLVGRIGGEEFCVLLQDADQHEAGLAAERLRRAVDEAPVLDLGGGRAIRLTISVGVATILPGDTLDRLAHRADDALYAAKAAGRNRVHPSAVASLPADRRLAQRRRLGWDHATRQGLAGAAD